MRKINLATFRLAAPFSGNLLYKMRLWMWSTYTVTIILSLQEC